MPTPRATTPSVTGRPVRPGTGRWVVPFTDDVSTTYIPAALAGGMISRDPFRSIDPHGVARLVGIAVEEGRAAHPGLVTGVCGEHGGDPASIAVFHRLGLDHVSCSASRVEVARLAAARAALGVGGPSDTA